MHRADRLVGDRAGLAGEKTGYAEIRHLYASVGKQHDVLRLDVAVDDALGMGVHEGAEYLRREMHSLLDPDDSLLLDVIFEGYAVDVLHDDILKRRTVAYVENLDDIRVVEQRDRAGFVAESAAELLVVEVLLAQDLDCHYRAGVEILRLVNDSHASVSDLFEYFIPAVQDFAYIFIHID